MKKRSFKILSVFLMLTIFISMLNIQAFAAATITLDTPSLNATAYLTPKIRLTWNSVSNANLYYIYRLEGEGKTLKYIDETTGTTYDDKNIKWNTNYSYVIRAYTNKNGTLTAKSNISNLVKSMVPNISKVSSVTATTVSDSKIKLSWGAVSTAERYYLYYGESGGSYQCLGYLKSQYTSYTFSNLKANTKYWFKVKATRNIGGTNYTAGYSQDVSATTNKAGASTTTTTKNGEFMVDFKKISNKDAGLPTGSAITCLAMLLNFYGVDTEASDLLPYFTYSTDFYYDDKGLLRGPSPEDYFVGDPKSTKAYAYGTRISNIGNAEYYYLKDKKVSNIEPDSVYLYDPMSVKEKIKNGGICLVLVRTKKEYEILSWRSGDTIVDMCVNEKYCILCGYTNDNYYIVYDPANNSYEKYSMYPGFNRIHALTTFKYI